MGSSSQEQIVDQHSADVDPNAWMSKYPVGTLFESSTYTIGKTFTPDRYKVVTLSELQENEYYVRTLQSCYLPVKLVRSETRNCVGEYDGFMECHIGKIISKPATMTLRYTGLVHDLLIDDEAAGLQPKFDTVTLIDCSGGPWIPTPEELGWVAKDSLKPQPKFGWWG